MSGSWDRKRLEPLLGEPIMVDDPLITVTQAAAVTDLSSERIRRMIRSGRLTAHPGTGRRQLLLSEVLEMASADQISVREAAAILNLRPSAVNRLVRAGLLTGTGGDLPVTRREVRRLAERRADWVTIAAAAERLTVAAADIHRLLNHGVLRHTGDAAGPIHGDQVEALDRLHHISGGQDTPQPASMRDLLGTISGTSSVRVPGTTRTELGLYLGTRVQQRATLVIPVGVLNLATAPQLRDVLLKRVAEQPEAVVVDLALLHIRQPYLLSTFGVVAQETNRWCGTQLMLVAGQPRSAEPDVLTAPISRFIRVFPTIDSAYAAIDRGSAPVRLVVRKRLPADYKAVSTARTAVRETCEQWGCAAATATAETIAAELVTNAVEHARTRSTLRLELRRDLLTVAVTDHDPAPAVLPPAALRTGAGSPEHGLRLVRRLATAWNNVSTVDGKTVWATVRTAGPKSGKKASGPGAGA